MSDDVGNLIEYIQYDSIHNIEKFKEWVRKIIPKAVFTICQMGDRIICYSGELTGADFAFGIQIKEYLVHCNNKLFVVNNEDDSMIISLHNNTNYEICIDPILLHQIKHTIQLGRDHV